MCIKGTHDYVLSDVLENTFIVIKRSIDDQQFLVLKLVFVSALKYKLQRLSISVLVITLT